ncbi:NAD-dependent epimerase/dehydratase family protein [Bradyrhizobium sp. USDA 10063]
MITSRDFISPYIDRLSGQSVLVTGGNGFIGQRLASRLLAHNAQVTLLQRQGDPIDRSRDVLIADFSADNADAQIAAALKGRQFNIVFNLAAYGVTRPADRSVDGLCRERILARRVNVDAAKSLFLHARETGCGIFLQAGTCSEYAPQEGRTLRLETDPLESREDNDNVVYGASKATAGRALLTLAREGGPPLIVARIFNVYGPGEKKQRLLPSLVHHLARRQQVPLSAGSHIKDYLHLDDVVEGLCAFAVAARDHNVGTALNLCSGSPISVAQFSRAVAGIIGHCDHLLGFGERPAHPDEVSFLVGSTAARNAFTDWRPRLPMEVGLPSVVHHMMASTED